MLNAGYKAEAQRKLKNITAQLSLEQDLKDAIKNNSKIISENIANIKDEKAQLQLLKKLGNTIVGNKITALDSTNKSLQELEDRMKSEKEKLNKEKLYNFQDKERAQTSINEYQKTIVNIQKTVKDSVAEEEVKRKKIEDDLEVSLEEIRQKIATFQTESQTLQKQNEQLRVKVNVIKEKVDGIEGELKKKADQKDEEVRKQKQQLTDKLKVLELQVNEATELNKEYSAIQKKNFDKKLSLYLRNKKFPQHSTSFESSAKTLVSCKQELLKGVQRMNVASETFERCEKKAAEIDNIFLGEIKLQAQKQAKIQTIKKQKEVVRARILALQNKLKMKNQVK